MLFGNTFSTEAHTLKEKKIRNVKLKKSVCKTISLLAVRISKSQACQEHSYASMGAYNEEMPIEGTVCASCMRGFST